MPIAPTNSFFTSAVPSTVFLESSTNFDGSAQSGAVTVGGGVSRYAAQAAGGLLPTFDHTVEVSQILYLGGGTLTVLLVDTVSGAEIPLGTITTSGMLDKKVVAHPKMRLKFTSSGATNPKVFVTGRNVAGL